jgi:hypothetical protein
VCVWLVGRVSTTLVYFGASLPSGDAYLFDLDYKAVEESFDMDAIGGEDDDVEKLAQEAAQLKPRPQPGEVEVEPTSYLGKRVRVDKASTAAIQRFVSEGLLVALSHLVDVFD